MRQAIRLAMLVVAFGLLCGVASSQAPPPRPNKVDFVKGYPNGKLVSEAPQEPIGKVFTLAKGVPGEPQGGVTWSLKSASYTVRSSGGGGVAQPIVLDLDTTSGLIGRRVPGDPNAQPPLPDSIDAAETMRRPGVYLVIVTATFSRTFGDDQSIESPQASVTVPNR